VAQRCRRAQAQRNHVLFVKTGSLSLVCIIIGQGCRRLYDIVVSGFSVPHTLTTEKRANILNVLLAYFTNSSISEQSRSRAIYHNVQVHRNVEYLTHINYWPSTLTSSVGEPALLSTKMADSEPVDVSEPSVISPAFAF